MVQCEDFIAPVHGVHSFHAAHVRRRGLPAAFESGPFWHLRLANQEKVNMTEFGTEPSFRSYLQILRRRKWWVVLTVVLGLAGSLAFALTAHKEYSATAQLLVQPSLGASGF